MPNTHCLPSGSLGTNEVPVPPIIGGVQIPSGGLGSGNIRGIVVWLHGLGSPVGGTYANGVYPDNSNPVTLGCLALCNNLVADGWIVFAPVFGEDGAADGNPSGWLYRDVNSDPGGGSRYLAQMLHWWDHVVLYLNATYGTMPIVPFGFSWGGWHAVALAANKQSTLTAFGCHCPANIPDIVWNFYTNPLDFSQVAYTWQGLDQLPTALNSVTVPGMIGYGTIDNAVGFSGSTVRATSNGGVIANIASWSSPNAGVLRVTDNTQFNVGPGAYVYNNSGAWAFIKFTGTTGGGGGGLLGCTYVTGSAGYAVATGDSVIQSGAVQMIAAQRAAQPSHQVSSNAVAENHAFSTTDATTYASWFTTSVDPICPKAY